MLPIPDPSTLIQWANTASYEKLVRFINNNGARGHSEDTIARLIRVSEQRRWIEEEKVRKSLEKRPAVESMPVQLNRVDRLWAATQRREMAKLSLNGLRGLEPSKFEEFVSGLFTIQGYHPTTVGGPGDFGVDVEVRDAGGQLWAVVQCKRYAQQNRVSTSQIMAFCGAFEWSKATVGFIFTTGELTRNAIKVARGFPWLTVYSGYQLVEFIQSVDATAATPAKFGA